MYSLSNTLMLHVLVYFCFNDLIDIVIVLFYMSSPI